MTASIIAQPSPQPPVQPSIPSLVARFEVAANAAQQAETEIRRELAARIAQAQRHRVHAYRRMRLIKTLAETTSTVHQGQPHDEHGRWSAQRHAVAEDLGWSTISESYAAILDRLRLLADAVHECRTSDHDAGLVYAELATFEKWFEDAHKKPFYELYDQYVQEVPVVDF